VLTDSLEGILTFCVAVISPWLVKDWPKTTHFLSPEEREHVMARLEKDVNDIEGHFQSKFIWQAFKNFKMYIMVLIYLGANCGSYAIAFFLPTIINDLGYSAATYIPSVAKLTRQRAVDDNPALCLCLRRDNRKCLAL
jgi:hypothetical protein